MSFGAQQSSSSSEQSSNIAPEQLPFLEDLWGGASNLVNGMSNSVTGTVNPWLQQGMGTLMQLGDPSGQIATQTDALSSGLGAMFQNEIMPSIQGAAIGAGGFGGGRQGVAEGVAAGKVADAFTQGVSDITGRANSQALMAMSQIPAFGQTYGAAATAALDPWSRLAQIIGNPQILNSSKSESESSGFNFGIPSF